MPIKLSEMMKIPTPRQILETGDYKGIIAGVVYPNDTYGKSGYKMQFLLQVLGPKGICYMHSVPFYLSLVETGEFFKLMQNVSGATNADGMADWLDEAGYVDSNDEVDETRFIGLPVIAHVVANKRNGKDIINHVDAFNFCPDDESIQLDTSKLIPKMYGSKKTKLIADDALGVVK